MSNRIRARFRYVGVALVATCLTSFGPALAEAIPSWQVKMARGELKAEFPGVRLQAGEDSVWRIHGPMTEAESPDLAAQRWLAEHAAVLGVDSRDLDLRNSSIVGRGTLSVFRYDQSFDGLRVESGRVRVLVANGPPSRVVYVSARVAVVPAAGLDPATIPGVEALASVRALEKYAHLTDWSVPQLVVLPSGYGRSQPVRAWKIRATTETDKNTIGFFVHAASGRLLHARDESFNIIASGQVTGNATPGTLPDTTSNSPEETELANLLVTLGTCAPGFPQEFTHTDDDGDYALSGSGDDIAASLRGKWVTVQDRPCLETEIESPFAAVVDFLFNEDPDEFGTAQVNSYVHVNKAHDFYADRQSDELLDESLLVHVDSAVAGDCDGKFLVPRCELNPIACEDSTDCELSCFNGLCEDTEQTCTTSQDCDFGPCLDAEIHYGQVGTNGGLDCVNPAYAGGFIGHEYGHFVHWKLGHPLGTTGPEDQAVRRFAEGFSDAYQILVNNDPVIGREALVDPVTQATSHFRDIVAADKQYPCQGQPHDCGQLLAGVWWDIKLKLQLILGGLEGLDVAYQLFTDWAALTAGYDGADAAGPNTLEEVLLADDDDADSCTMSPHWRQICYGFAQHSIAPCPVADSNGNGIEDSCE